MAWLFDRPYARPCLVPILAFWCALRGSSEQTRKSPEASDFALRECESFVRWPSKAVDRATCRSSTALEGHRTEKVYVCSTGCISWKNGGNGVTR